jgi:hypothetical protein
MDKLGPLDVEHGFALDSKLTKKGEQGFILDMSQKHLVMKFCVIRTGLDIIADLSPEQIKQFISKPLDLVQHLRRRLNRDEHFIQDQEIPCWVMETHLDKETWAIEKQNVYQQNVAFTKFTFEDTGRPKLCDMDQANRLLHDAYHVADLCVQHGPVKKNKHVSDTQQVNYILSMKQNELTTHYAQKKGLSFLGGFYAAKQGVFDKIKVHTPEKKAPSVQTTAPLRNPIAAIIWYQVINQLMGNKTLNSKQLFDMHHNAGSMGVVKSYKKAGRDDRYSHKRYA